MIKTKEQTRTISEEVVIDVLCNKCGKSLKDSFGMNYDGLVEKTICGNYDSKIGDGVSINFLWGGIVHYVI